MGRGTPAPALTWHASRKATPRVAPGPFVGAPDDSISSSGGWPIPARKNTAMIAAPTALGGAVVGTARTGGPFALAVLVAVVAACGSETAATGVTNAVASLTITVQDQGSGAPSPGTPLALAVGDSLALSATATNALGFAVSGVVAVWSSSAPSIVTVSGTGVAKALAAGSADVSASVDDVSATVRIGVSD